MSPVEAESAGFESAADAVEPVRVEHAAGLVVDQPLSVLDRVSKHGLVIGRGNNEPLHESQNTQ
ncbi:hypothetical protein [Amycolatopsis magusensis]|uniref:Uncharacterized protein n=1 Tax=Amycolatopsis magusensis TaxID=882444 RepID=A0ABS4PPN1_9PSEU|nr:hypothetical protein [Amycolatopsis magusensis]MBP2181288.1 hypothetical protein [Amycolatopsis magusensis]